MKPSSCKRKKMTYKGEHRSIGSRKYRSDKTVRPRARPVDSDDEVSLGRENQTPYRHARNMLLKLYTDKVVIEKLCQKWGMARREAEEICYFIKEDTDWELYLAKNKADTKERIRIMIAKRKEEERVRYL